MKSVLIVFETLFKYSWQGSAARILDFAHALTSAGWECTLLSGRHEPETPGPGPEDELCGRIVRTPFYGIYPDLARSRLSRKMYRILLSITGRGRRYRDPEFGWPSRAVDWYIANHFQRPDVVIGMTTGLVGNLVAARLLADHFRVPLVLEFQDPCPSLDLKKVYPADIRALHRSVEAADLIMTTTSSLARDLAAKYPSCKCRFEPVYMSYDESYSSASTNPSPDTTVILHAGTLAGGRGRNVRVVVEAIARANDASPGLADRIRLELLGGGVGGAEAKLLATSMGIGASVEVLPPVSRDEAMARMARANILLLVKYAEPKYAMQIPGKVFQYLGQGLPILGVMPRETEAADILRRSGLGVVFDNADAEGITGFIESAAEHRINLVEEFVPDWEYIQQFSLGALGRILEDLLSSVVDGDSE